MAESLGNPISEIQQEITTLETQITELNKDAAGNIGWGASFIAAGGLGLAGTIGSYPSSHNLIGRSVEALTRLSLSPFQSDDIPTVVLLGVGLFIIGLGAEGVAEGKSKLSYASELARQIGDTKKLLMRSRIANRSLIS